VPDIAPSRRRILVAGTSEAIEMLAGLLHEDADLIAARSVHEALGRFDAQPFDTVACNVRFDESRMFDFLQALRERPAGRRVHVVCFRLSGEALSPGARNAIASALEALGVPVFVDLPQLTVRSGTGVALEVLRQTVLSPLYHRPHG
jgi:response regulator RpfG family c-di-GMP phosphodiesterase